GVGLVFNNIEVARVHETCVHGIALSAAAELSAFHKVFQGRNRRILVAKSCVGDFVENDDFPRSQDADCSGAKVDKEICRRGPATGNREYPRRDVTQEKGFSGLSWPKFHQIDVSLDQRNKASQKD